LATILRTIAGRTFGGGSISPGRRAAEGGELERRLCKGKGKRLQLSIGHVHSEPSRRETTSPSLWLDEIPNSWRTPVEEAEPLFLAPQKTMTTFSEEAIHSLISAFLGVHVPIPAMLEAATVQSVTE
jgi:hypothetical protein